MKFCLNVAVGAPHVSSSVSVHMCRTTKSHSIVARLNGESLKDKEINFNFNFNFTLIV